MQKLQAATLAPELTFRHRPDLPPAPKPDIVAP